MGETDLLQKTGAKTFTGFHCQDCVWWERINGKGCCLVTGNARWPGDEICEEFAQ